MVNLLPAILIGGPPHAGKSVLAYSISQALRKRNVDHCFSAHLNRSGTHSQRQNPLLACDCRDTTLSWRRSTLDCLLPSPVGRCSHYLLGYKDICSWRYYPDADIIAAKKGNKSEL